MIGKPDHHIKVAGTIACWSRGSVVAPIAKKDTKLHQICTGHNQSLLAELNLAMNSHQNSQPWVFVRVARSPFLFNLIMEIVSGNCSTKKLTSQLGIHKRQLYCVKTLTKYKIWSYWATTYVNVGEIQNIPRKKFGEALKTLGNILSNQRRVSFSETHGKRSYVSYFWLDDYLPCYCI